MKEKQVSLSGPEINHVLSLISQNEAEGWYFAPKDQYWKRSERIKKALSDAVRGEG